MYFWSILWSETGTKLKHTLARPLTMLNNLERAVFELGNKFENRMSILFLARIVFKRSPGGSRLFLIKIVAVLLKIEYVKLFQTGYTDLHQQLMCTYQVLYKVKKGFPTECNYRI